MSGIAAIVRFDGGPVAPGAIEAMTPAMAYRGPDGIAHWHGQGVALGHCMMRTTAEALEERQPLANEDASLVLVMDGWLANPDELRADLLARGARLRDRSDAELVLRAYETWGEDCPRHIDGEFALLVWDARRREAFIANDHIGLKSLFWHWDGARLLVASDIVGILAGPGVEARPNPGKIAEFLAHDYIVREQTIWQGVMRCLPAEAMRFGANGPVRSKYWEPPKAVTIRYRRDEDYFDHYRQLFADCVRRSARSHLPLACDVSGGLDSSAVFCMARELQRRGDLPAPALRGYTYLWDEMAGTGFDEIEFARAAARHADAELREIRPFLPDLAWFVERGAADATIAGYPNGAMAIAIGEALVADGSRVILNGEGGDEWVGGKPFYYAEQLCAGAWPGLVRTLREDAADIGVWESVRRLVRKGVMPALPAPWRRAGSRLAAWLRPDGFAAAGWLNPAWRSRLEARRSLRDTSDIRRIANPAQRSKYMTLNDPFALIVWDQFSRQSARLGYEIRTPMYAREFIDFAFATPERIRRRGDTLKFVHIGALRGIIPDAIADRRTKAEFDLAFTRHFAELAARDRDRTARHRLPLAENCRLEDLLEAHLLDPSDGRPTWLAWNIFAMGELLDQESLTGEGSADAPAA
jgi:asparagine synthase (glutamine-hydrolysing)